MRKIVIVDDQPVLASIYRSKFAAEGFHVDVATDGEAALEVIQRVRPDLVLLDLMLPKINGIEVLKRLRAHESFKTLPIVVFSSSAQPKIVEAAWGAGASMVLSKSSTSPKQLVESAIAALEARGPAEETTEVPAAPATNVIKSKSFDGPLKKRILLVDTNPDVRALLSLVLSREGLQTTDADGCAHALMLSEVVHFDLVLVNKRSCFESVQHFCQQIRRRHSSVPVVMYLLNGMPAEAKQALDDGASVLITSPEQLLKAGAIANAAIEDSRKAA